MISSLKYVTTMIGFREVPDEISLCINISNCPYNCYGCHSKELQTDIGTPLNKATLDELLYYYKGNPITCITFLGDGDNFYELGKLVEYCKYKGFKTCIYTGSTDCEEIIKNCNNCLDFLKIGKYVKDLGPLDSKNTNQKFYSITYLKDGSEYILNDITYKFRKNIFKVCMAIMSKKLFKNALLFTRSKL